MALIKTYILITCYLLLSVHLQAQTRQLTGTVKGQDQTALAKATIIAKSQSPESKTKWAMTDEKGFYSLELDSELDYELEVSYISYEKSVFNLKASDLRQELHFHLKIAPHELGEVVINYQYSPMLIKKDTVTFRLDAFTSGDERKLKEALEKLPGMEVDDNGQVRFQGNIVNKTLVENRLFFGGGSKLAVENIPADAVDKIELISNFSEIDFLKDLLLGEELAMNVQLKKDKKNLFFGDLEASAGLNQHRLAHAALFKYTPKNNISLIADHNSLGKAAFSLEDAFRFQGGSQYLLNSNRPTFTDLYALSIDNTNLLKNESTFAALHYDQVAHEKWSVTGFGLYSHNKRATQSEALLEYINPENNLIEMRNNRSASTGQLAIGQVKINFRPDKFQSYFYNAQVSVTDFGSNGELNSKSLLRDDNFKTHTNNTNWSFNQYIEWHKAISHIHTLTAVVNHQFKDDNPLNSWINSQAFLTGLIPMQEDKFYHLTHTQNIKNQDFYFLVKHYWNFNQHAQLHTSLGTQIKSSQLFLEDGQKLSNGQFYDFIDKGFGGNINYRLQDYHLGLTYRLLYEKFQSNLSLTTHFYAVQLLQSVPNANQNRSFWLLEPSWKNTIAFNTSEKLHLDYSLQHSLPQAEQLRDAHSLSNYNTIFKGNSLLDKSYYHSYSARYSKLFKRSSSSLNVNSYLNKSFKTLKNQITYQGLNSYRTPILMDDPETNWNTNVQIQTSVWKLIPSFSARWSWSNYHQSFNAVLTNSERFAQNYTVGLRLHQKTWPDVRVQYTKGFSKLESTTLISFSTDRLESKISYRFLKNWLVTGQFENLINKNQQSQTRTKTQQLSTSLDYEFSSTGWGIYLSGHNLLASPTRTTQSITEYLITEQTTFVLPRIVLYGIRYKI